MPSKAEHDEYGFPLKTDADQNDILRACKVTADKRAARDWVSMTVDSAQHGSIKLNKPLKVCCRKVRKQAIWAVHVEWCIERNTRKACDPLTGAVVI
jgi:hypothetical protein